MAEERSFPCPNCGRELRIDARIVEGVLACPGCNQHVSIPSRDAIDAQAISVKPIARDVPLIEEDEPPLPDIRIKAPEPGESLTIPALLMPVFTAGLLYFG